MRKRLTEEIELPSNPDAERLVLGCALTTPNAFPQIASLLTPADFSLEKHKRIFHQMGELYDRGESLDRVSLINALDSAGQLPSVDGLSYVVSLSDGMPQLASAESFCRIIRDKATLRNAITAALGLVDRCLVNGDTPADLVADAEGLLQTLNQEHGHSKLQGTLNILDESGGVDKFFTTELSSGIATPFPAINETIIGLQPEQLFLLAARPAVGKSAFALQMATHAAMLRKRTVFYSLEMSSRSLLRRAIISRAGVSGMKLRIGMLSPEEKNKLSEALYSFSSLDEGMYLQFSQEAHVTAMAIRADLQRMKSIGRPVDLVVIDYLQLMGALGRHENKVQEVTEISRGLKLLAKEFKIPVLSLSQLSRATETRGDGRPVLSDLRDSGSLEQDADAVLFLWPESKHDKEEEIRTVNWAVAKQREGPTNEGKLIFRRKLARFEEESYEQEQVA